RRAPAPARAGSRRGRGAGRGGRRGVAAAEGSPHVLRPSRPDVRGAVGVPPEPTPCDRPAGARGRLRLVRSGRSSLAIVAGRPHPQPLPTAVERGAGVLP